MTNSNEQFQGQTKKCPKCQENIQLGANKCKHCGADLRNWFVRHKIITGFLVLIALIIIGSAMSDGKELSKDPNDSSDTTTVQETKKEEAEEVIKISAVDLAEAYEENKVKADKDYKNKTVEIIGNIRDIGVVLSQTYVVLSSGKDFALTEVQCFFSDKEQIEKVAELNKDDTITVQGIAEGKSLNVSVKKCELK